MEQHEYDRLLCQVDRELTLAKAQPAQRSQERQAKEDALGLVRIQRLVLQAKLTEFAKLGGRSSADLPALIDALKQEERALEKELALPEPAPNSAAQSSVDAIPLECPLDNLLDEIDGSAFSRLASDHAATLYLTWALRWRIEFDRLGPRARDDRRIRLVYARMRRIAEGYPTRLPYIRAFRPGSTGNWAAELEVALVELRRVAPRAQTGTFLGKPEKVDWRGLDPWQKELLVIATEQNIVPPGTEGACTRGQST